MSFLRRKNHRHRDNQHATDGLNLSALPEDDTASVQTPSVLQTPSIKSTNLRKRLSSFSLLASTLRRGRSQSSQNSAAVGFITPFRLRRESHSRSRSPSPEPSLEIRRPSGLGRRASVIDLLGELPEDELAPNPVYGHTRRKRSISTPELTLRPDGLLQWSHLPPPEASKPLPRIPEPIHQQEPEQAALSRLSSDQIKVVFACAAPADLASAALACKSLLEPVRTLLYGHIDLQRVVDGRRMERCISLLASRRDLAGLVDHFACDVTPSLHGFGGTPTISVVTFAIALNNMQKLTSLVLPHFDATLLYHSSFHLRKLTLLCDHASNDELRDTFGWLDLQPTLTSISFPNLILSDDNTRLIASTSGQQHPTDPHSPPDSLATLALPSTLLPALAKLQGPATLVAALIHGRPVTSVSVHIHRTIYDGLRPSSLVSEIAKSAATISHFGLATSVHHKIDGRTVERVLMSAGSSFGEHVQTLEITTTLEDEALRKAVGAILPRYRNLHALRLHRRYFALLSTPPVTPSEGGLSSSPLSSPLPEPSPAPSTATSTDRGISHLPPRMAERASLTSWSRHCNTLRHVVFPSTAEWQITHPAAVAPSPEGKDELSGSPTPASFTYLGLQETESQVPSSMSTMS